MRWRHFPVADFANVFRSAHRANGATTRPPAPSPDDDLRRRRERQALEQEEAVFEQRREQDAETFRLRKAMGWATFAMVPGSIGIALIEPWTLTATTPATMLAFWNWRRLLGQEQHDLTPVTRRDQDPDPPR